MQGRLKRLDLVIPCLALYKKYIFTHYFRQSVTQDISSSLTFRTRFCLGVYRSLLKDVNISKRYFLLAS